MAQAQTVSTPAPGQAFPAQTLPDWAIPDSLAPGQSAPGQAVPGQIVPGQAAPRRTMVSAAERARTGQALTGAQIVYLEADSLVHDVENERYVARGDVQARAGERVARADEAYYYPDQGRLVFQGNIIVIEADGTLQFADSADFSDSLDDGVAVNFSMRMANGGLVAAAYGERRGGVQNILTRASYTACPVCEDNPTPTWRMLARRAVQDADDEMIYYRDVTFQVAGIPILYSPFFAHADPSVRRKTGFLFPMIGYSTITGLRYEQPYFWAIGESQDLTITPIIMDRVAPLLELNYRKRFYSGYVELEGTITREREFDSSGDRLQDTDNQLRGHIFGSGVFALSENWSWGFGVEHVTDDQYLQRYDIRNIDVARGIYRAERHRLVSQLYVAGQSEDFYATVAMADFQSLRERTQDRQMPQLLPIAEYRRIFDFRGLGRMEFLTDIAMLERSSEVSYLRLTSWADWRARHVTDFGLVVEPFARARGDYYQISDALDPATGAPKDGSADRVSAFGGLDFRYPFVRPGAVALTLEPRAQVIASAGRSNVLEDFARPDHLGRPVALLEDSLTAELNVSNLFSPERFAGFDLIEEGLRANVGVRMQADWRRNSAHLFVGQSYNSEPDVFSPASGLARAYSDYVVEGGLNAGIVSLDTRLRINPDDYTVERFEATGRLRWRGASLMVRYYNLAASFTGSAPREYVVMGATAPLTRNVAVSYTTARDMERNQTRYTSYSISYVDDCLTASLVLRDDNTVDRLIGPSQSIYLFFTLKSLGSF